MSQSYVAISINNPELARLCKEYGIKLRVRGDTVSYKYDDFEGAAYRFKPEAKDFVDWFLNFIKLEDVADDEACEQIELNRKNIEDAFVKSTIVVSHIDESDGCYWEEKRNKDEIKLKGFDNQSWDRVWNSVSRDEISKLYDGDNVEGLSPENYPLRQLISDNWGFKFKGKKDQAFFIKMMDRYGTSPKQAEEESAIWQDQTTKHNQRKEENGFAIDGDVLTRYKGQNSIVIIPEGITSIGSYAFFDCKCIRSIVIPNGVTSIEEGAFYGCSSLESITISDSVKNIEKAAFCDCSSLESITIPYKVKRIEEHVFLGCISLTRITIPQRVKRIGYGAFSHCSSLESITISDKVREIEDNAFDGCEKLTICAHKDSYAEEYAKEKNIPFVEID